MRLGVHDVPIIALPRGDVDLSRRKGVVISCLLQKFRKKWTVEPLLDRTLVICDEAHVGIPEDGTYVKNAEAAFGQFRSTVLFTATPKAETLKLYGMLAPTGQYMRPFHVYTQMLQRAELYFLAVEVEMESSFDEYANVLHTLDRARVCAESNHLLSKAFRRLP